MSLPSALISSSVWSPFITLSLATSVLSYFNSTTGLFEKSSGATASKSGGVTSSFPPTTTPVVEPPVSLPA